MINLIVRRLEFADVDIIVPLLADEVLDPDDGELPPADAYFWWQIRGTLPGWL